MLVKVLPDKEREQARNDIARLLPRWWSEADPAEAAAAIIGPLRRRLWRRALLVAVGLVGVSTLYMGLLAWTMIPIDAAEDWVGSPIDVAPVDLFGVRFDVPLGPYVIVSTLFGTLASAVLLASVAVDEDYAQRLAAALLERPVADALMLSAPYLAIREGSTD